MLYTSFQNQPSDDMRSMQERLLLQSQLPARSLESRTQKNLRCLLRRIMRAPDEMPLCPVLVAAKFFIAVAGASVLIEKAGHRHVAESR